MPYLVPFLTVFLIFTAAVRCDTGNRNVSPPSTGVYYPPPGTHSPPAGTAAAGFVWYGPFSVRDGGGYKTLLKACNRCGAWRTLPGGRIEGKWSLFGGPERCKHWLRDGGLQIVFAQKELPTNVLVTMQPHYNVGGGAGSGSCWGHPFTVKGVARAVNESKGFSIALTPDKGMGGQHALFIQSDTSNHVSSSALEVKGRYAGGGSGAGRNVLLSSRMAPQNPPGKKAIADIQSVCAQISQGDCLSYSYGY